MKTLIASVLGIALLSMVPANAADESVVIVTRLYAAPGQAAALEERMRKIVDYVRRAEPDALVYRAQRSKMNPSLVVVYEVFRSEAAFDHHRKAVLPAFDREFGAQPDDMLSRPPELEYFQAWER
jgi:quinol monooxygenase YgiN